MEPPQSRCSPSSYLFVSYIMSPFSFFFSFFSRFPPLFLFLSPSSPLFCIVKKKLFITLFFAPMYGMWFSPIFLSPRCPYFYYFLGFGGSFHPPFSNQLCPHTCLQGANRLNIGKIPWFPFPPGTLLLLIVRLPRVLKFL